MVGRTSIAVTALVALLVGCSGGSGDDGSGGDRGSTGDADSAGTDAAEQRPEVRWLDSLVPQGFRGAVALVEGGETVFAEGFGSLTPDSSDGSGADSADASTDGTSEGAETITPDTRFDIGSITKDLTDIAVRLLQDQGALRPSDRLGDLLPGVPPDKAGITVDQLMAHTAGLHHVHGQDDEQIGKDEALTRIFGQELRFEPGTDELYSNSGYTLLAAIVEEVSGRTFEDFLRQEIFEPTGMAHTGFRGDPVPSGADEAIGLDDREQPLAPSAGGPISWTLQGNGGVVSTVADMLELDRTICGGAGLPDGVVQELPYCGEVGAFGTAGGGSEFSHTASWEKDMDRDVTLVVLSAGWEHASEDVALALLGALLDGQELPSELPEPQG